MRPWWDRFPDRFAREKEALGRAGYEAEFHVLPDVAAMEAAFAIEAGGELWPARAKFPAEYPYFRPEVYCADLPLVRHYHPFAHNICLLPAPTHHWSVDTTLAELLTNQLPDALEIGVDPQGVKSDERETRQGEPYSAYYTHLAGSAAFLGRAELPHSARFGQLKWAILNDFPPRVAILEISDQHGNVLFQSEEWLAEWAKGRVFNGKWRRLDEPYGFDDPKAAFEVLGPFPKVTPGRARKFPPQLHALIFPEESGWRRTRDGFLFAINGPTPKDRVTSGKASGGRGHGFVRTQPADSRDLLDRVPELEPLRNKHVLLIGLGMLGSHAALHLARSMIGKLTLVDFDYIEAGSIVRWALGLPSAGLLKTKALASHIGRHYPFVDVSPVTYKLGAAPVDPEGRAQFLDALDQADLVFDATAEIGVSNYLKDVCGERGIPHIYISGTPGGWGGQLGRSIPTRTGCWSCFKHHQADHSIPTPNAAKGEVQPRGCANPTATGSGFDMDQLATAAVRLAVSSLCGDEEAGYPDGDYDCLIVNFRDEAGTHIAPDWRSFKVPMHPECPHAKASDFVDSRASEETP